MDQYVNRPNKVVEAQRLFQTTEGPVFLKAASDRMIYRGMMGLSALAMVGVVYGCALMFTGKGKIQRF